MPDYSDKSDIEQLRQDWSAAWGKKPPSRIGRAMMARSLAFRKKEQIAGGLPDALQKRLNDLLRNWRRNPGSFDPDAQSTLKPGTRLVRTYNGTSHSVLVTDDGFEYNGHSYASLSAIANEITGTRWNGLIFFGIKRERKA